MIFKVFAIYDRITDTYGMPLCYDNEQLAVATVRRQVRDSYIDGKVTYDALRDMELCEIGVYNNEGGHINGMNEESFVRWPLNNMLDKEMIKEMDKEFYFENDI